MIRIIEKPSPTEVFLKLDRKGVDSLDLGLPSSRFFPERLLDNSLTIPSPTFQYSPPDYKFKERVAELMKLRGENYSSEDIIISNGSQEAIFLLTLHLLSNKRYAIVDEYFYPNFKLILNNLQKEAIPIALSKDSENPGMDLDILERVLKSEKDIGCIYTVPSGHNPQGWSLSAKSRERIAALAERYDVPIIEDDPYGFLSLDRFSPPSIKSYAPDQVYYVGSFSKILAPSLRSGWIIAPQAAIVRLGRLKEGASLNVNTFGQYLVKNCLETIDMTSHIENLNNYYKRNRDLMIEAVNEVFPVNCRFQKPTHGFFLWLQVPDFDFESKLDYAIDTLKVTYIPGSVFSTTDTTKGKEFVRLNYSHIEANQIDGAIRKFSGIFS